VGDAVVGLGYFPPRMNLPPPRPHHDDRGYWEGAAVGELRIPRCHDCGRFFWPGGPVCPSCLSTAVEWTRVSGRGRVSSWVRFHKRYFEGADVPYVVAQIDLDERPRLFATLHTDDPRVGLEVEVVFTPRESFVLPEFVPRGG
jgi:uncharacterized OB-fold protein